MSDTRKCNANKNTQLNQLAIGLLNVCGLKRRSLFPEFSELIHNYDLFMVTETKLDLTDIIVTGYMVIRYIIHLYCLAVQAGFYSDVVECPPITQKTRVRIRTGNI